ncbi:hypothetical protein MBAV_000346 [Candidatus Magnetobacterium bavaricum]|uniref:Uncharacterized protein n=1 Tax=Candidatus Magnetobacterium bavaricum TaxID=29290 RepID=A0A0F3H038_9BACT|nr:hypothetical protein MBAV_000346 [Candidatus Magnetobacterium bavaricum]
MSVEISIKGSNLLAGGDVPQFQGVFIICREGIFTVGGYHRAVNVTGVIKGSDFVAGGDVPQCKRFSESSSG